MVPSRLSQNTVALMATGVQTCNFFVFYAIFCSVSMCQNIVAVLNEIDVNPEQSHILLWLKRALIQ